MPFDLEQIDVRPLGEQAPLQVAIIQIRFRPKLAIEDPSRVTPFQEALEAGTPSFELFEEGFIQALSFQVGPGGMQQSPAATPERVWKFRSADESCVIDLNRQSLSFEVTKYETFPTLKAMTELAFNAFATTFGAGTAVTRVGVRYVNKIAIDGPLPQRINPALISPVGTQLGADIESSLNQLVFREDDGKVRLVHGLVEPQQYILDFDCFTEDEQSFDTTTLMEVVEGFHDRIEALFTWALTKEYLIEIGAIEAAGEAGQ